jgi:phage gp45-like
MNNGIKQLAARIRNLFSLGEFQKRYSDGTIQVQTVFGRVVEKKEAFPYGFKARAKKGKVMVLCRGGNFDGFEVLPVLDYEGGPELEEGDAALYTESGGWIVCRADGQVELNGKVKAAGGSFECAGTASPTGQGCLCAKPFCSWDGSPQSGSKAEET